MEKQLASTSSAYSVFILDVATERKQYSLTDMSEENIFGISSTTGSDHLAIQTNDKIEFAAIDTGQSKSSTPAR